MTFRHAATPIGHTRLVGRAFRLSVIADTHRCDSTVNRHGLGPCRGLQPASRKPRRSLSASTHHRASRQHDEGTRNTLLSNVCKVYRLHLDDRNHQVSVSHRSPARMPRQSVRPRRPSPLASNTRRLSRLIRCPPRLSPHWTSRASWDVLGLGERPEDRRRRLRVGSPATPGRRSA